MRPLWRGVGHRPDTKGLFPSVAAEVFLCTGILTGWIGSRNQIKDAQEIAKNLITESISYYESELDAKKVAEARTEIAYCYWRDGELNEARIMLLEALERLTTAGFTRVRQLLSDLTSVYRRALLSRCVILDAGRDDLAPHPHFQILALVVAEERVILTVAVKGTLAMAYLCQFLEVPESYWLPCPLLRLLSFLRVLIATPANPVPSSNMVVGSGIGCCCADPIVP